MIIVGPVLNPRPLIVHCDCSRREVMMDLHAYQTLHLDYVAKLLVCS